MQFVCCCLLALAVTAVNARDLPYNEPNMPITLVKTSYGLNDHERVDYIKAVIHPRHINADRTNFPASGHLDDYFKQGAVKGDERGHLVASQFSGPADWYNLSPQNYRVNRNMGYRAITKDWFGAECEVRIFLDPPKEHLPVPADRYVIWEVYISYQGKSNRPDSFRLLVTFFQNGKDAKRSIDTIIPNPVVKQDDRVYICRLCGATIHGSKSNCEQAPKV